MSDIIARKYVCHVCGDIAADLIAEEYKPFREALDVAKKALNGAATALVKVGANRFPHESLAEYEATVNALAKVQEILNGR